MERKNPSREGSRRLSAKPSKGSEMKKAARQLGLAAAESDKDSGFSDGSSECLSSAEQMESEDMLSALGWSREDKPRPSSKPASGAFPTLSPMVVMKNVLVKQGSSSSQLQSWTVQPSFEVISAQPQLLFLHPPVPSPVSPGHAGEKKIGLQELLAHSQFLHQNSSSPWQKGPCPQCRRTRRRHAEEGLY